MTEIPWSNVAALAIAMLVFVAIVWFAYKATKDDSAQ